MFPLEFRAEVNCQETETRVSEDRMIVDGQTESIIAKTALCIASYADALSKTWFRHSSYIAVLTIIS